MMYKNQVSPIGTEKLDLIEALWLLWLRLAVWSRSLIVSTAGNLGDIPMITDKLEELPEAFSGVLGRYFEPQDADRFRELLEEHISSLAALIAAEKNSDIRTVNQETENLYLNADRMASFLAGIIQSWNAGQWIELLNDYIEMILADLVARMAGEFAEEINIFEDLQTHVLKISDYMAQGILQKFFP